MPLSVRPVSEMQSLTPLLLVRHPMAAPQRRNLGSVCNKIEVLRGQVRDSTSGAVDAALMTCYYEMNSRLNKVLTWVPTSQHGLSFGSR